MNAEKLQRCRRLLAVPQGRVEAVWVTVTNGVTKLSTVGVSGGDRFLQIAGKTVRNTPKTERFKANTVRFLANLDRKRHKT